MDVQWSERDVRDMNRAIAKLQTEVSGKRQFTAVLYPAREYTKKVISRTKQSTKATVSPEAWWTDDARWAQFVFSGKSRIGFDKLAVESNRRQRVKVGGRGFAKQTWSPIARALGVTVKGKDETRADIDAGRRRTSGRFTSAKRRGIYADHTIRDKARFPYIILQNWSPAIVNQDRGSKGMPPRNIHKFGMLAASKNLERQLQKMSRQLGRAWA